MLPIGGVKEKLTAAHRAGLKHIILPWENKKDMEDVPEKVLNDLKIDFVKEMRQVLEIALEKGQTTEPAKGPPKDVAKIAGGQVEPGGVPAGLA